MSNLSKKYSGKEKMTDKIPTGLISTAGTGLYLGHTLNIPTGKIGDLGFIGGSQTNIDNDSYMVTEDTGQWRSEINKIGDLADSKNLLNGLNQYKKAADDIFDMPDDPEMDFPDDMDEIDEYKSYNLPIFENKTLKEKNLEISKKLKLDFFEEKSEHTYSDEEYDEPGINRCVLDVQKMVYLDPKMLERLKKN